MSDIILMAIGGSITTFVAGFTAWIFARKRNNADGKKAEAEAEISELDSVEKAIKIWRETAENLLLELNKKLEDNRMLGEEIRKLNDTITTLGAEVNKLKSINNRILCALRNITPETAQEVVDKLNEDIKDHV